MYITKADREVITKTLRVAVEELYQTPKNYEANDVILSPAQVSEEFPFITQHYLKRYGWLFLVNVLTNGTTRIAKANLAIREI